MPLRALVKPHAMVLAQRESQLTLAPRDGMQKQRLAWREGCLTATEDSGHRLPLLIKSLRASLCLCQAWGPHEGL